MNKQRFTLRLLLPAAAVLVFAFYCFLTASPGQDSKESKTPGKARRVLVFSGTGWYRHPEIAKVNGWLVRTLGEVGYAVDVTETAADISTGRLAEYQLLVINNANELDKVFNEKQRTAIADWYKGGHGLVALHAALVHQTKWPWFNELAGCDFNSDSEFSKAKLLVDPKNREHPAVRVFGPHLRVLRRLDQPRSQCDRFGGLARTSCGIDESAATSRCVNTSQATRRRQGDGQGSSGGLGSRAWRRPFLLPGTRPRPALARHGVWPETHCRRLPLGRGLVGHAASVPLSPPRALEARWQRALQQQNHCLRCAA